MQLTESGMEYENYFLNILCRIIFASLMLVVWVFVCVGVFFVSIIKWGEYVWDVTDDAMSNISTKLGVKPLMKSKWIKVDKLSEGNNEED